MGGVIATRSSIETSESISSTGLPKFHDPDLIQFLKLIYHNDFAKDAFINFIRHEEICESEKDQNYFKRANFAIIGEIAEKVSEVLSKCEEDSDSFDNNNEMPYYSLQPFFNEMDPTTKNELLSYRGGSSLELLSVFQKLSDEIVLLMAIEALPRFKSSDSYKRWWNRERSYEFSVSEFFSHHGSSRRTATLQATTGKHIEVLWTGKHDIFPGILHCLDKFPIASVILHSTTLNMVYVSQSYAQFFGSTPTELVEKPFNIPSQNNCLSQTFQDNVISKSVMKCRTSSDDASIAIAIKPIKNQHMNCLLYFVVIVNLRSQSFCLDTLKLSMDLFDIFPNMLLVKH